MPGNSPFLPKGGGARLPCATHHDGHERSSAFALALFERLFGLVLGALGLDGEDLARTGVDVHLPRGIAAVLDDVHRPEALPFGRLQLGAANPATSDLAQSDPLGLCLGNRAGPVGCRGRMAGHETETPLLLT